MLSRMITCISFSIYVTLGLHAQDTQIKGFASFNTTYKDDKVSFGFDEQDLFINSIINDRLSFLGESVFKISDEDDHHFIVSIERLVLRYNLFGNNDLIVGKIHTALNYWNNTFHHGRVFYPTCFRPLLFSENIIPLHVTGIGIEGHDMGDKRIGYHAFISNGQSAGEIKDNNADKSITLALTAKPIDRLKVGVSYYNDRFKAGEMIHGTEISANLKQQLITLSAVWFGRKLEAMAEGMTSLNKPENSNNKATYSGYIYGGYRLKEKWISYLRYDNITYPKGEIFYHGIDTQSFLCGLRYEMSFLAAIKLEYQHTFYPGTDLKANNILNAQFAIGF